VHARHRRGHAVTTWLVQHLTAMRDALRRLFGAPLNTLLSLLVIGVALTLPTAGWLAIENLRAVAGDTPGVQQISIFLTLDAGSPRSPKSSRGCSRPSREAGATLRARGAQAPAGPKE
jgi:hypothetical protein